MSFLQNTEILKFFEECTEEELSSVEFLENAIKTKIGISLNVKTLEIPESYYQYMGGMKMKQYPNEFAQYLAWLYKLCKRKDIRNYLCIGPERGGEFFTVDSFFRRMNANFDRSLAIDISPKIRKHRLAEYQQENNVDFICSSTRLLTWDDVPFDKVDYCFIDGDHSYEGVKHDFEMVKDHCRYIALHDIHCTVRKIEVKRFWDEIKGKYKHWEFANTDPNLPKPVGIGIIKL